MRTILCILSLLSAALAEEFPVTRLAGVSFKVADLEKTRQFYTGILGLEEAFDLKDASGAVIIGEVGRVWVRAAGRC